MTNLRSTCNSANVCVEEMTEKWEGTALLFFFMLWIMWKRSLQQVRDLAWSTWFESSVFVLIYSYQGYCCFTTLCTTVEILESGLLHLIIFHTGTLPKEFKHPNPVKNLSSQLTHWELTWRSQKAHQAWVTVSSFWGHLSNSQCTHKMSSLWDCCELSMSL